MKTLREYDIEIFRLSNKLHEFRYEFDDRFFENFDNSLISKGNGTVELAINKTTTLMELNFRLKGTIELICDRSLEPFDFEINSERDLIIKFGDVDEELSDEISMIHWDTQRINVAQYIYEFIGLEIPMKKLHPRFEDEGDQDEMIYQSEENKTNEEDIDPRWEALKGLKNK